MITVLLRAAYLMQSYTPGQTIFSVMREHTEAGRHDEAAKLLRIAKCNPATAAEAQVWEGMQVLSSDPHRAYRLFNSAVVAMPDRAELHLLQARAAALTGEAELAHQLTENALYVDPLLPTIRVAAWRSRARTLPQEALQQQLLKALPDITDGSELAAVLPMLPAGPLGVVAYDPITSELSGWAIDPTRPNEVVQLECLAMNQRMVLSADHVSPLLRSAGLPGNHGGIRLKVPAGTYRLDVRVAGGNMLSGSPLVPLAPLVNPPPPKGDPRKQPVDILIPVYRGEAETLACIHSVLAARKLNGVKHEIIVLEDASPEPALVAALIALAQSGAITLVRHPANLGFIRGMNRGMIMHPERDVIWLNADTLVHGNWVDRLRQAAYSSAEIASVTPFSNNGELMSFPEPSKSHVMPDPDQLKHLDSLAAGTKTGPVRIDVGNGFCMYLRRKAMATVGFLDEVHMARGYGEETDWCLRATVAGFQHVGAPNVFVAHKGEVSFGPEKRLRVKQNLQIINNRYPWAEQAYSRFTLKDPLEPIRNRLQTARLNDLKSAVRVGTLSQVLQVLDYHTNEESGLPTSPEAARLSNNLCLTRDYRKGKWWAVLRATVAPLPLCLRYVLPDQIGALTADLAKVGVTKIDQPSDKKLTLGTQAIIDALGLPAVTQKSSADPVVRLTADDRENSAWVLSDSEFPSFTSSCLQFTRRVAACRSNMHLLTLGSVPVHPALQATGAVLISEIPMHADASAHARAVGAVALHHQFNDPIVNDADSILPSLKQSKHAQTCVHKIQDEHDNAPVRSHP